MGRHANPTYDFRVHALEACTRKLRLMILYLRNLIYWFSQTYQTTTAKTTHSINFSFLFILLFSESLLHYRRKYITLKSINS